MVMRNEIMLSACVILFAFFPCTQPAIAQDHAAYCNAVQNKVGFIRYPLGTIGAWSNEMGEMGSVMTRAPRVYPCLDSVVVRPLSDQWRFVEADWRASISGDPSMLVVKYQPEKPCGATTTAITVTPHVSVFKVTFPEGAKSKYLIFDFGKSKVDPWAKLNNWKERILTRVDNNMIEATMGEPGKKGVYYVIKFSTPCASSGTIVDTSRTITEGAHEVKGPEVGMYARFDVSTVTVVIAESFTSIDKAKEFLASEFTDFDTARQRCLAAWNQVLSRVEIEGSETSKRMAYTALYTLYANIIDGGNDSYYSKYYSQPRSLSSSDYWQFIGGFQSCCWDNFRTAYPFLMLSYPEEMKDIVNTYLARYQRDGFMGGNICLFTGPMEGNSHVRNVPVLIAQAYENGIQADHAKLYAALKDNFGNAAHFPASISQLGYVTQPPSGGKACSHTLEYATSLHSMALLAKANNDLESMRRYARLSKSYANLWDSTHAAFRVKNADGSWGPLEYKNWTWNPNPQGLFEGTTADWMFAVPHDPYGLINLPGQKDFVKGVIDYCANETWFNDYQYHYPYLLYYAGAANEAQKILRTVWVPLFQDGVMYEEVGLKPPRYTSKNHYTSNAGWLICSMLGLYPSFSPAGQYIITSPSIAKAVIHHGGKDIIVQTENNTGDNIYIRSIKVDGKVYPCYMIPAKRLVGGAKIEIEMGSDPAQGLGSLYVSSTDGYVQNVQLISSSHLKCTIAAAIDDATTKIYSHAKPVKVMVNGKENSRWDYDEAEKIATIQSTGAVTIEVFSR